MVILKEDSIDTLRKYGKVEKKYDINTGDIIEITIWGKDIGSLLIFKKKKLIFNRKNRYLVLNTNARDYFVLSQGYFTPKYSYDVDMLLKMYADCVVDNK